METQKRDMLERVLGILDPEMVSDERIVAFHDAAALYRVWSMEIATEIKEEENIT